MTREAMEAMGVKTLEQEPCGDAISRQAVWDVMQELWGTSGELLDRLMALPSVNPQEPVLDMIRAEIMDFEEEVFHRPNTDYSDYAAVRHCVDIIDKHTKG